MISCDVAISVESFLHQPSSAVYSFITQPSSPNNWMALLLEHGRLFPILLENSGVAEVGLSDPDLLRTGNICIEPLLAEDWNSPEDDIWDAI